MLTSERQFNALPRDMIYQPFYFIGCRRTFFPHLSSIQGDRIGCRQCTLIHCCPCTCNFHLSHYPELTCSGVVGWMSGKPFETKVSQKKARSFHSLDLLLVRPAPMMMVRLQLDPPTSGYLPMRHTVVRTCSPIARTSYLYKNHGKWAASVDLEWPTLIRSFALFCT
jgi:hypothetical protein